MKDETRNSHTRNSAFGSILFRVSIFAFRISFSLWRWLRAVLDDDAYEQYLRRLAHRAPGTGHWPLVSSRQSPAKPVIPSVSEGSAFLLPPAAFYVQRLHQKYSQPSRCC